MLARQCEALNLQWPTPPLPFGLEELEQAVLA